MGWGDNNTTHDRQSLWHDGENSTTQCNYCVRIWVGFGLRIGLGLGLVGICKDEAGTIAKGFPTQMLMELCKKVTKESTQINRRASIDGHMLCGLLHRQQQHDAVRRKG
jgi:hypothetical protein